jgi:CelD/BcsL family acetyltransferase involved in cellulose biosynthesis
VVDYLIWEVIQRAKSEGFKTFDLGEGDQRLSKYKSKFDPALEPYWTLKKASTLYRSGLRVKQMLRALK